MILKQSVVAGLFSVSLISLSLCAEGVQTQAQDEQDSVTIPKSFFDYPQTCSEAYLQTSKSFSHAALEAVGMAFAAPFIGVATIIGGPLYYAAKEVKDLGTIVVGSDTEDNPRIHAAGRVLVKNPTKAIGSIGGGALIAALGIPGGFYYVPHFKINSHNFKKTAEALEDLEALPLNLKITDETPLGENLERFYKSLFRRGIVDRMLGRQKAHVPKRHFVGLMRYLTDNRAICPEGAVYTRTSLRAIIRGFAHTPGYRIPEDIYSTADWLQTSLTSMIRDYEKYEAHTQKIRMAGTKKDPESKKLYEGFGKAFR